MDAWEKSTILFRVFFHGNFATSISGSLQMRPFRRLQMRPRNLNFANDFGPDNHGQEAAMDGFFGRVSKRGWNFKYPYFYVVFKGRKFTWWLFLGSDDSRMVMDDPKIRLNQRQTSVFLIWKIQYGGDEVNMFLYIHVISFQPKKHVSNRISNPKTQMVWAKGMESTEFTRFIPVFDVHWIGNWFNKNM